MRRQMASQCSYPSLTMARRLALLSTLVSRSLATSGITPEILKFRTSSLMH